ncbi:MAG: ATP phosphoribosyltransferase regulatory subunit, partial [Flavobacterium sp.]
MAQKPSIPKGTRDFSSVEVARRQYIIRTIQNHFETFGFQPIETPSFENSETLMGKYGEEGDRLIFKILDSGDFFEKSTKNIYLGERIAIFLSIYIHTLLKDVFNELYFSNSNDINEDYVIEVFKLKVQKNLLIPKFLSYPNLIEFVNEFLCQNLYKNYRHFLADVKNKIINNEAPNFIVGSIILRFFQGNLFEDLESFLNKKNILFYESIESKEISKKISEKALRYDLTVPFARYVVMHQNELEFPFKRYQIQPVWRADRPQKGRFREFYQCDADVVGSHSLWQEVEFVQLYDAVFTSLGLKEVTIKINNRKILSGFAEVIGASDKLIDFTIALDKLDKIGIEGVTEEMLSKGISKKAIELLRPLFEFKGTLVEKIHLLYTLLKDSEEGK